MAADIRPARAGDIDALAAVERAEFPTDRISRKSFARLIRSPSAAVLAAGEPACGYCVVLFRKGARAARLYSIAVARVEGGGGVGRALLEAAERAAASRGCDAMRLEVREDNLRARKLYERNGYTRFARIGDYYADGSPALRYQKPLGRTAAGLAGEGGRAGGRSKPSPASGVLGGR
jgi:ribosomal protein S18 acetylase RimI-like enzyme